MLTISLSLLLCSSAFADMGDRGGRRGPFPGNGGYGNDQLRVCLQDLDFTRTQLQICQRSQVDQRELDRLRFENDNLRKENLALRDRLDQASRDHDRDHRDPRDPRDSSLGFFSYAGCKDFQGGIDLKLISEATGSMQLEAEFLAKQKLAARFSCSFGISTVKTEEIRTNVENSFCLAGCKDFQGNVDLKFVLSGKGRNKTEAEFNAVKAVGSSFRCNYGIKVQACQ